MNWLKWIKDVKIAQMEHEEEQIEILREIDCILSKLLQEAKNGNRKKRSKR